jgi:hypothetical protein
MPVEEGSTGRSSAKVCIDRPNPSLAWSTRFRREYQSWDCDIDVRELSDLDAADHRFTACHGRRFRRPTPRTIASSPATIASPPATELLPQTNATANHRFIACRIASADQRREPSLYRLLRSFCRLTLATPPPITHASSAIIRPAPPSSGQQLTAEPAPPSPKGQRQRHHQASAATRMNISSNAQRPINR